MSSTEEQAEQIQAKVLLKFGIPLSDVRRGIKTPLLLSIPVSESLHFTAARIREGLRLANPDIDMPENIDLYLKTSTNCRQTNYLHCIESNWLSTLQVMQAKFHRRSSAEQALELFVYVENEPTTQTAPSTQTTRRLTATRVQAAATRLQAHFESLPADSRPGNLEMRYIAEYNARLPENAPLQLPENTLRRQLRTIESMEDEPEEPPATVTLRMLWSDVWIPVKFNSNDFMRAFITQNAEQRRQILAENFATVAVNQSDVDHED